MRRIVTVAITTNKSKSSATTLAAASTNAAKSLTNVQKKTDNATRRNVQKHAK